MKIGCWCSSLASTVEDVSYYFASILLQKFKVKNDVFYYDGQFRLYLLAMPALGKR